MLSPYEVLEVPRDADAASIKAAYRRLAHQLHPDKHPGHAGMEDRFKALTEAYQLLSDPARRRQYDRFGTRGFAGAGGFDPSQLGQGLSDALQAVMREFFGGSTSRSAVRQAGQDRSVALSLDFLTACRGGAASVDVLTARACADCAGTGAPTHAPPQPCDLCQGRGELRVRQGLLSLSKRCSRCAGRGQVRPQPCPACAGRGWQEATEPLTVSIPAGVEDGATLLQPGRGRAWRQRAALPGPCGCGCRCSRTRAFAARGGTCTAPCR